MPDTKEGGSMYETVKKVIETVDSHGERITRLEDDGEQRDDSIASLQKHVAEIRTNFTSLENTIWKTAQSTQDMMSSQNAQQWELIKALNANNEEDRKRKHEYKKSRMEKFWEFAGKFGLAIFGSGGFLILLLELLTK